MAELRKAVSSLLKERLHLDYYADEFLIAGGARPVIYGTYVTILNEGDTVVFRVPSWNNNHYCHLTQSKQVFVETKPENNFMPTAEEIKPHLKDATLLSLCSPLNPTGTTFKKEQLEAICDLVLEENKRRGSNGRPLYLMYDQIYWVLTFGDNQHYNPVSLRPEMKEYTIFIDGVSKSLAATGIRVGWTFGPRKIMDKMKSILSHIGAWSPKAEQVATAKYLQMKHEMGTYVNDFKKRIDTRLVRFYEGFTQLKKEGYKVDAIAPQAAIYLTVQLNLAGMKTKDGNVLKTQKDVTQYILDEAKLALVPFSAFGASENSSWYRLSVGTCNSAEIDEVFTSLRNVLGKLS
jgi:aspartate aminotransferase